MSEKTIENDFDKAVEFIVESDFNKNLNKCLDIVKELDKKDKEIERLNNIINELERLLNNQIETYKDSECEELQAMVQEDKSILFILKELKGDGSNE